MSWFRNWFGKKKQYPFPLRAGLEFNSFEHRLQLDCGCAFNYSQRTKQLIKDNINCTSEEEHKAEIKENMEKEQWDGLKEMYKAFNGKQEVFGNMSGSGLVASLGKAFWIKV